MVCKVRGKVRQDHVLLQNWNQQAELERQHGGVTLLLHALRHADDLTTRAVVHGATDSGGVGALRSKIHERVNLVLHGCKAIVTNGPFLQGVLAAHEFGDHR